MPGTCRLKQADRRVDTAILTLLLCVLSCDQRDTFWLVLSFGSCERTRKQTKEERFTDYGKAISKALRDRTRLFDDDRDKDPTESVIEDDGPNQRSVT